MDSNYPLVLSERVGSHDSTRSYLRYDNHNRLVAIKTPTDTLTHVTRLGYDATLGNVSADTTPGNAWRQYFTNRAGDVVRVWTRRSAASTGPSTIENFVMDIMGRSRVDSIVGVSLAWTVALTVENEWSDATPIQRGLVRRNHDAEGRVVQLTRLAIEDSSRKVVLNYDYDALGRAVREWEASPYVERLYEFDASGSIVRSRDRNGVWVRQAFDALGRPVAKFTPSVSRAVEACSYCLVTGSQPATVRVPYFRTRLSATTSTSEVLIPSETTVFGYDRSGNLILADNPTAQVRRSYYPNGALHFDSLRIRDYAFSGSASTWNHHLAVLSHQYDFDGRRTLRTDSFGGEMRWFYGDLGQLDSISDRGETGGVSAIVHFQFDASGRLIAQKIPGTSIGGSWSYDPSGRPIKHVELGYGLNSVVDSTIYDPDGRKLRTLGNSLMNLAVDTVDTRMAYDAFGHLVVVTTLPKSGTVASDWFSLDALGHRTRHVKDRWRTDSINVVNVDSSLYAGERLTRTFATPRPMGLNFPGSPSTPYRTIRDTVFTVYDQNGAVVSNRSIRLGLDSLVYKRALGGSTFDWMLYDAHQRLRWSQRTEMRVSGTEGGSNPMPFTTQLDYWYDALGRRVQVHTRTDSAGCSGFDSEQNPACNQSVLRTTWDGDQILRERRWLGHRWLADVMLDTATTFANYLQDSTYGAVRYTHAFGIDNPVILWRGGPLLIHRNWRGSIAGTTSFDTTLTFSGDKYPTARQNFFFAPDERSNLNVTRFWYGSLTTEQTDGSGLLYRRNRYYDPTSGRFTQPDPIGLAGGLNLYGYAGGDPINRHDPFGLSAEDVKVNCRPVGGEGKEGAVAHCAVRVVDESRGIDQTIELAPDASGNKEIYWALGGSDRTNAYDSGTWLDVAVPDGMTSTEFDNAVLLSAFRETVRQRGQNYWPTGNTNSNRFVRQVIINAGGQVPAGAASGFTFGAPGLCGGVVRTGSRCP